MSSLNHHIVKKMEFQYSFFNHYILKFCFHSISSCFLLCSNFWRVSTSDAANSAYLPSRIICCWILVIFLSNAFLSSNFFLRHAYSSVSSFVSTLWVWVWTCAFYWCVECPVPSTIFLTNPQNLCLGAKNFQNRKVDLVGASFKFISNWMCNDLTPYMTKLRLLQISPFVKSLLLTEIDPTDMLSGFFLLYDCYMWKGHCLFEFLQGSIFNIPIKFL